VKNGSGSPDGLGSRLKAIALRALLFAVFLTISGYGMSLLWNRRHPPKPLHTFSSSERASFVDILKAKGSPLAAFGWRVRWARPKRVS
jgi:hypothetical protein